MHAIEITSGQTRSRLHSGKILPAYVFYDILSGSLSAKSVTVKLVCVSLRAKANLVRLFIFCFSSMGWKKILYTRGTKVLNRGSSNNRKFEEHGRYDQSDRLNAELHFRLSSCVFRR